MNFTGERFIPNMELESELAIEHFQRYHSIKDLVRNKVVVDAACGEGYGSFLMSEVGKKVYGIDISAEAVNLASEKYVKDNLEFIEGSIEKLPFEDNSIDVLISFETIEHVGGEIQDKFLKEAKRILKEDGIFIISTPDKKVYSDRYNYKNEFHIKEFYKEEFEDFLRSEFKFFKMYYQYFEVVALLNDMKENKSMKTYNMDNGVHEGKYLIAVASNKELEEHDKINSIFINNEEKYMKLIDRIFELQGQVEERSVWGITLDKEIANKDILIKEIKTKLQEGNIRINQNEKTIREMYGNIEVYEKEIEERKIEIEDQKKEIEEHKTEIEDQKKEIKEYKIEIEDYKIELNNRNAHIELLLERDRELQRITSSRSWRFMGYVWKTRDKLAPNGSKRRLLIKIIIKFIKHPIKFIKKLTPGRIRKFLYYLKREGVANVSSRLDECVIGNNSEELNLKITNVNISNKKKYKVSDFEKLTFPKVESPKVSIIIPVYNEVQYTYACLKSILENSNDVTYEIIIANDCSTDVTSQIHKFVENINVITTELNLRFLLNCNNAAKYAKGEYILFLNNDTQVQENWLKPLVDLIERDESIGMVGSKLIYPDGRLQEAGGIIWDDASGWNYGRLSNPQDPEFNYVKECDFISGAAIMIKHNLWKQIGGFDDHFAPAYYEDTDLAFEVRKYGYKVMLQPLSVVVHFEGVSNGVDISSGQKSYQVKNAEKFKEKWKNELEHQFKNAENVFVAKDRSGERKHILVIDHYVPNYDKDAGGKCTYMYLKLFVSLGMKVTFIGDNFYPHQPYTSELQQMGIEVLYGNYYSDNWKKWIEENGVFFDYVYLNRPHISEKYIDVVRKYTNAKIMYFGSDLHYLREYREYEVTGDKSKLKLSNEWKKREFDLFNKVDVIHVVGSYEQELLKKEFNDKPIRNIPVYIYNGTRDDVDKNFMERKNIIFVGGFGHPPNADAVLWFAEKMFPSILEKYPDIIWYIVGSKPPKKIQELACKNIVVTGFISDEELANLYEKTRMAVVPLRIGAGVKGKVVEAAYNQIPFITTPIGSEGLSVNENAFVVASTEQEFIDNVIELYEDFDKLKKLSDNSIEFIQNYFTYETAKKVILSDISLKYKEI